MNWKRMLPASVCSLALLAIPATSAFADTTPSQTNLDTLTEVYKLLVTEHYSQPDQDKVLDGAIQGMLNTLNDPFTDYFTPDEYQSFTDAINQQYAGIGVALQVTADGQLAIATVYPNSPAEKAGLKAGAVIAAIDHQAVTAADADQAAAKIRGAEGTSVVLTVVNGTSAPQDYTLTRQAITLPTVQSNPNIGDNIAYIRIFSFGEKTGDEFAQALSNVQQQHPKGLVLDLRDNGGGYVGSMYEIADSLLKKNDTIVIFHDANGQPVPMQADQDGTDLPITVLVNRNTASASEMLTSALQLDGRAKVIGEQTFGKGTMQTPVELPNGSYLKLSVDQWDMPNGKTLDRVGLTPDVTLTDHELDVNAAMQALEPQRAESLAFSRSDRTAVLNGNSLSNVPSPQLVNGQAYLPLRFTMEALGAEVDWQSQAHTASFHWQGHAVVANLQSGQVQLDGQTLSDAKSLQVIGGSLYLSSQALNRITGGSVDVTPQTITIHSN